MFWLEYGTLMRGERYGVTFNSLLIEMFWLEVIEELINSYHEIVKSAFNSLLIEMFWLGIWNLTWDTLYLTSDFQFSFNWDVLIELPPIAFQIFGLLVKSFQFSFNWDVLIVKHLSNYTYDLWVENFRLSILF